MQLDGIDPFSWRRIIRRCRLGTSTKLVAAVLAETGTPGTEARNTGNGYRPPNQAPNRADALAGRCPECRAEQDARYAVWLADHPPEPEQMELGEAS